MFKVHSHVGPEVRASDILVHFVKTEMSQCVVCQPKYLFAYPTVGGDNEAVVEAVVKKPEAILDPNLCHAFGCRDELLTPGVELIALTDFDNCLLVNVTVKPG